MSEHHDTRRAPHMEKYVQIKRGAVWLVVGNQSFIVGADVVDPDAPLADQLRWMRDMLCIALDELVKAERQ